MLHNRVCASAQISSLCNSVDEEPALHEVIAAIFASSKDWGDRQQASRESFQEGPKQKDRSATFQAGGNSRSEDVNGGSSKS